MAQASKLDITQSFKEWSEDKASRLAASLAYYTIFSIPPLLIIVLAITGQVFDDAQARITAEINSFIGETGGEAIVAILENASEPTGTIRYGSRLVPERGAVPLTETARMQQGIPRRATVVATKQADDTDPSLLLPSSSTAVLQPSPVLQRSANRFHHAVVNILAVPTAIWRRLRRTDR